ncbi:MAG TPA: glycine cleavage T C-terminal barrel domain-containing protein [Candidatus Polarisedimenticolia bacterium]|nr:glycine cleavage T C-terminal barrel domain-containing protein [Candidatus Polarisedimenticolia bacterium]
MSAADGTGPATADPASQYRAGHEGAVLAERFDVGRLAIGGRDSLDLLHRLTTNDIKGLAPGAGTAAVFTTPKGRILDLVTLHRTAASLLCLCDAGRATPLREWIERYTFREDVAVQDLSATHGTLGVYGPRAASVLEPLAGRDLSSLPLHHVREVSVEDQPVAIVRSFPLGGDGFLLTTANDGLAALRRRLGAASNGALPVDPACLEVLRIEAGMPAAGRELREDFNPWEARLQDAISLAKGCYVGQEVIARLHTYNKVSKMLVRLLIAGEAAPRPGDPLEREGEATGSITSVAAVPGAGRIVALGYVRDEDAVAGTEVLAGTGDSRIRATIEGVAR